MKTDLFIASVLALIGCSFAWPDLYDNEFKRWSLSRRSFEECKSSGGKCYSSSDCCNNYLCAAFDELGLSPTYPGWCVHEKHLEPCLSKYDCDDGKRCVSLGEHSYCVPLPKELLDDKIATGSYTKSKGGKGSNCETTADCAMYAADGETKLCCQKIRRGRQGLAQKCDVITPISNCLN